MRADIRNNNNNHDDLEAHYGSSPRTDVDDESSLQRPSTTRGFRRQMSDDAPSSYMSSSASSYYYGAGDDSTVGAMTTESSLIRGTAAFTMTRNAKLGQDARGSLYDDDDEPPSNYSRVLVGKDYSLYDLSVDGSGEFENIDLERSHRQPAASTGIEMTTTNPQTKKDTKGKPEQTPVVDKPTSRSWLRLDMILLMLLVFVVAFLAVYFAASRLL